MGLLSRIGTSKWSAALNRFRKAQSGNVTVMMGLTAIPFLLAAGSAVDYERAVNAKHSLQTALDTAALYGAQLATVAGDSDDDSNTSMTAKAQNYIDANYSAQGDAALKSFTMKNYSDRVEVTGTITLKTWFMSLGGISSLDIVSTSMVKKAGINLEVSLVLDNTNSMNTKTPPSAPNTPIVDLKAAATNFVNTVMPTTQGQFYTKIAVVPYNNSVNLDTRAVAARGPVTAGTSTTPGSATYSFTGCQNSSCSSTTPFSLPITNCVTERTGAQAYTDAAVASNPVGRGYLGSANGCTVTPMIPLTTNAKTLTDAIASMTAVGSTAGQVGIGWGWYTLSPTFGLWTGESVPSGYDKLTTNDFTKKVKKIMVLMTDAEYNSASYNGVITGLPTVSGSGGYNDHINKAPNNGDSYVQSNAMCQSIKNSGVEVYVITFQLDTSVQKRVDLANNCATDSAHVINAANSSDLNAVMNTLANTIIALRIAK